MILMIEMDAALETSFVRNGSSALVGFLIFVMIYYDGVKHQGWGIILYLGTSFALLMAARAISNSIVYCPFKL